RYGRWVAVDEYGPAWVPLNVDAGWSPYWVGRWVYRPFWGWTWVSYEPWGWVPYHYGRWHFRSNLGWCWLPGPSLGFHFWSPGLCRIVTSLRQPPCRIGRFLFAPNPLQMRVFAPASPESRTRLSVRCP